MSSALAAAAQYRVIGSFNLADAPLRPAAPATTTLPERPPPPVGKAAEHGHHIPGTPFTYRHGWIPSAGGGGATSYRKVDEVIGAPETHREELSGGLMGTTHLVTFANGRQAVHKALPPGGEGIFGNSWTGKDGTDAEVLGARVARALGVPAPQPLHRDSPESVYMEYVKDAQPYAAFPIRIGGFEEHAQTQAGLKIGLLDTLIQNHDRNPGNLMVGKQGQLTAIDHNLAWAFGEPDTVFADRFYTGSGGWRDNPLSRQYVESLRPQLEALRPEFEALNRGEWLDRTLEQLNRVATRAKGTKDLTL